MTTKAPSAVSEFPPESLEKIAYNSVSSIPAQEPNDLNRLGYHIWRWLVMRQGTIDEAIRESGARIKIQKSEAASFIREALAKQGVTNI